MTESNDETQRQKPGLDETVEAIRQASVSTMSATMFYGLSDITTRQFSDIKSEWEELPADVRRKIMLRMAELSETDFEMDFRTVGIYSLNDSESDVREAAIGVLWDDETTEFLHHLMRLIADDPSTDVRARALKELGRFILMGELGRLQTSLVTDVQNIALKLFQDKTQSIAVRRRALEAISHCSHEAVPQLIREAYYGDDSEMQISAIFAMGQTYDEQWNDIILEELTSSNDERRFEAIRASGELEIHEAIPVLGRLTSADDLEIREIAVWALGEIGGSEAIRILNLVAEIAEDQGNDEILDAVEEALGNASLVGGDLPFMVDVEDDYLDDA